MVLFVHLEMEDSLHISGVDNDESFAMLYASLDFAKTSNTDELTEVGFLLGKLADIRGKYDSVCNIIAVDMETMEEKHREGIAALDNKYDAMNEKFEELIHELTQEMEVKDANLNAATDQNNALMLLVVSIRKRKEMTSFYDSIFYFFHPFYSQLILHSSTPILSLSKCT